jgi:hypothetical protein
MIESDLGSTDAGSRNCRALRTQESFSSNALNPVAVRDDLAVVTVFHFISVQIF